MVIAPPTTIHKGRSKTRYWYSGNHDELPGLEHLPITFTSSINIHGHKKSRTTQRSTGTQDRQFEPHFRTSTRLQPSDQAMQSLCSSLWLLPKTQYPWRKSQPELSGVGVTKMGEVSDESSYGTCGFCGRNSQEAVEDDWMELPSVQKTLFCFVECRGHCRRTSQLMCLFQVLDNATGELARSYLKSMNWLEAGACRCILDRVVLTCQCTSMRGTGPAWSDLAEYLLMYW
jgi:hypothetical protein